MNHPKNKNKTKEPHFINPSTSLVPSTRSHPPLPGLEASKHALPGARLLAARTRMVELAPPWQVGKVGNRKNPAAQNCTSCTNPPKAQSPKGPSAGSRLALPLGNFWDDSARSRMADGYVRTRRTVLYTQGMGCWLLYSLLRRLDAERLARAN